MSNKDFAIDVIRKLPAEASLMDMAQELELIAGIREAEEEIGRGEGFGEAETRKRVDEWARSSK